jgi:hypothetical protein
MAGAAGKPGPPKRGHETVEQMFLEAQVLNLYDRNFTLREIADEVGMAPSSVGVMLKRINNRTLADFDRVTARALTLRKYLRVEQELWPFVVNTEGNPTFRPDEKMVDRWLKLQKGVRELMGADAPTRIEVTPPEHGVEHDGDKLARDLARYMELADKIAAGGIGSGRVVDAEVVEDETSEDDEAFSDANTRVRSSGSEAPKMDMTTTADAVNDRVDRSDDDLDDGRVGERRDRKLYPAESCIYEM